MSDFCAALESGSESEEEEEASPPLLDPEAVDAVARRHYGFRPCGWCLHGPKCMRLTCMSVDNPNQRMFKNAEKDGGCRVEVDCEKGLLVIRLTDPHPKTGKTEMTKANVDYTDIGRAFETPSLCFLEGVARPPKAQGWKRCHVYRQKNLLVPCQVSHVKSLSPFPPLVRASTRWPGRRVRSSPPAGA
jgi:hypothetical protein